MEPEHLKFIIEDGYEIDKTDPNLENQISLLESVF
jgi:hypothetical protein